MEIPFELPLDADGFIRRECPTCHQQFKWHHGRTGDAPADHVEPTVYYCPLCGHAAAADAWWTPEQFDYQQAIVAAYAPLVAQEELKAAMRSAKGLQFRWKQLPPDELPNPMVEPDDMDAVASPCHPWEPTKLQSLAENLEIHCLVCGEAFSV